MLQGDHDVFKPRPLEFFGAVERARDQRVFLFHSGVFGRERAAVDAHAHGDSPVRHAEREVAKLLFAVHIAGIHPYLRRARLKRQTRKAVAVMYIRDERQSGAGGDDAERFRRRLVGNGETDEVGARVREPFCLHDARLDIRRFGVQHGLHGDGRAAAYRDAAHENFSRYPSFCGKNAVRHLFSASFLNSFARFFISAACGSACEE